MEMTRVLTTGGRRALWVIGLIGAAAGCPGLAEAGGSGGQEATQRVQGATPPPSPFPNRLNDALPDWLRVRGEVRSRLEGFESAGFTETRDDTYWLNRVRLDATIRPSSSIAVTVQAQDARVRGKSVGPTGPPFRDAFDLRMAYLDLGRAQAGRVLVRLGRQELVFGEQRLVGHVSWVNTARTFDGVRVAFRGERFRLDAFGSSVVAVNDVRFNRSGFGSWFLGAYGATTALVPRSTVEPFLFWRMDGDVRTERGGIGDLSVATVGGRWTGTLSAGFAYDAEMALQTGSVGPDTVRAWAGHWRLRRGRGAGAWPSLIGEYNYASGDDDPGDGRRGAFDQLYPTAHDKYGLADQVGWRNIHHLRAGLELTPVRKLQVTGSYHAWWLASRHDALYSAAGAVVARVAGGAGQRHVGQELDVQAAFPLSPQVQLAGGYAHVFPGAFLKQATPGSSYSAPYLMVTYVFLADR